MLSEKIVCYKGAYAGTIDIVCGFDDFECEGIEFDEENHVYKYCGQEIPSVTQIISTGKYQYVNQDVLQKACDRGTAIHKEIETYIKDGIKGTSHEFIEFMKIMLSYPEVFNSKCVIDIKTYASLTPSNLESVDEQTSLYVCALQDTLKTDEHIDRYVLHLPKEKNGRLIKLCQKY